MSGIRSQAVLALALWHLRRLIDAAARVRMEWT
jgi:hypothetical protein